MEVRDAVSPGERCSVCDILCPAQYHRLEKGKGLYNYNILHEIKDALDLTSRNLRGH